MFNIVDAYSLFYHSLNEGRSHYIHVFICTHNVSLNRMGCFHFLATFLNIFLRELLSSSTLGLKQIWVFYYNGQG